VRQAFSKKKVARSRESLRRSKRPDTFDFPLHPPSGRVSMKTVPDTFVAYTLHPPSGRVAEEERRSGEGDK
jgi:hypothetical protein